MNGKTALIAAALTAVAACATTERPEPQMAAARAMVAQARPVASQDAPHELAAAQAKLAHAETAMQRGHYEHAQLLAQQAEADARLAWTVAEEVRTRRVVAEVEEGMRTLRDELERKGR